MEPPPTQPQVTTARTTNAALASRLGDALFASFLSLGQKGGRRLRRRNSSARQAPTHKPVANTPPTSHSPP
ncbi:protein of unknown function (plasmid) [Cupriavidus taiwanensis]|uniref:Uncharacterized protein n=1 Tax=Cupriavidus taiwanensis TaxID=164546 RepID=A0A7Z7JCP0_9BURK|nr:protein of unknown function [Cupriavidus taiwanensis]SOZ11976.1 protein of unknown function [Cupriavidus taiwanensis]SOZ43332.1 protein of unknown function [Cupriavidus taiwanensis]SPC22576.1 protein of unknown function [Cupriavidus taiwanensis]SPD54086.1 protein of unknown function [Cupriavidus taiwanensis]